jgi:hypothetical protein
MASPDVFLKGRTYRPCRALKHDALVQFTSSVYGLLCPSFYKAGILFVFVVYAPPPPTLQFSHLLSPALPSPRPCAPPLFLHILTFLIPFYFLFSLFSPCMLPFHYVLFAISLITAHMCFYLFLPNPLTCMVMLSGHEGIM